MIRGIRGLVVVAVLLSLSACGWHLRGMSSDTGDRTRAVTEPIEVEMTVEQGADAELVKALRRQMRQHGLTETDSSTLRLTLGRTKWTRSRLRTTAAGDVQSLVLTLHQPVFIGGGEQILVDETLSVRRDLQIDPDAVAASDQQRAWLQRQMREEMASRIVRLLEAPFLEP